MNTMNELLKLNSEELSVLEKYVKKGEDFVNVEDEHLQQVYAALIDKISGKGTWERNPWVYAYDFKLSYGRILRNN